MMKRRKVRHTRERYEKTGCKSKKRRVVALVVMERKKLAAFIIFDQFGEIVGVCLIPLPI
jgi:hypothetical protein